MTIPRFDDLIAYWSIFPPVHVSVASYFGAGSKPKEDEQDFSELMAAFPEKQHE